MKKPKTQYRMTYNGIDYRIQRFEFTWWFGYIGAWEDIWNQGEPATFDTSRDASKEIEKYIEQARIRKLKYVPVTTILS